MFSRFNDYRLARGRRFLVNLIGVTSSYDSKFTNLLSYEDVTLLFFWKSTVRVGLPMNSRRSEPAAACLLICYTLCWQRIPGEILNVAS